jgi:hypothetical protein
MDSSSTIDLNDNALILDLFVDGPSGKKQSADGDAEEAARFYAKTFPDSSVGAAHCASSSHLPVGGLARDQFPNDPPGRALECTESHCATASENQ